KADRISGLRTLIPPQIEQSIGDAMGFVLLSVREVDHMGKVARRRMVSWRIGRSECLVVIAAVAEDVEIRRRCASCRGQLQWPSIRLRVRWWNIRHQPTSSGSR